MIIYADILLLINFSMDFLTLYFTGRLLHRPINKLRFIAAATIGSVGGTVRTIVSADSSTISTTLFGFLLSLLMVLIAFGKNRSYKILFRDCFAVWGAGVFLGGIMTFVMSLGKSIYAEPNYTSTHFIPVFAICFTLVSIIVRIISSHKVKRSANVTVEVKGSKCELNALCDSGSFVSDPISGTPVIIVRKGVMTEIEGELLSDNTNLKIRVIPLKSISGDIVKLGFLPDKVKVNGEEKKAVVLILNEYKDFAGYDAILPAVLC